MEDRPPPINEVIGLLNKYDPTVLQDLQAKYNNHPLLKPGIVAGEKFSKAELQMRAEVCAKGLKAAIATCEHLIPSIKRNLKVANKVQLISQVMAIIGGASIFGTLQTSYPESKIPTYIAAAIALIGALMQPAFQFLRSGLHPNTNLFDMYRELIECQVKSKIILTEIDLWEASKYKINFNPEKITEGNALCARIMKVGSEV